ncbi:hypothetical protein AFE_2406 [Acidithiobacillus ferrooxidans ATCC 23270]|uniref:Uncharacterized protein n=1 Tax=Acidithiobacillus ferrooxidans (strain ATCC 23270 / DSM 14882 / CIP 104768 / NCIMB 8455) TaxID=243159 RepID=B7J6G7_ACIF2|nr:hypothetical protein AFE_2406 [Acidithiobacillus ferrooxidans ATCC 23270]
MNSCIRGAAFPCQANPGIGNIKILLDYELTDHGF